MNVFKDQEWFMQACGQTTDTFNQEQYGMYLNLIHEEVSELTAAVIDNDRVEQLDALIDILVVTIGAIHSMGADAEGAWEEVMKSNASKVDLNTGKVIKREDGKILKPEGWTPPNLSPFLERKNDATTN